MNGKSYEISIVIPNKNEKSIFELVDKLENMFQNKAEIIIVDKSDERFRNEVKEKYKNEKNVKIIFQKDTGVESAIKQGIDAAKSEIVASIDADMTHEPEGILRALELLKKEDYDLVLGERKIQEKGAMSFRIKIGNWIISWLFRKLYHANVHDYMTGLFVLRKSAYESIKNTEPYRAGAAFFSVELAKKGYKIGEVPIRYAKRKEGYSKITRSKTGYGIVVASHLIRQVRDYNPLLIFGSIGIASMAIGILIGSYVLLNFLHTGQFNEVGRALIAFMLVVLGILSIIAGFIIDLLLEIENIIKKR
ncbi:MAG: glycosyltransferase family 2 protein [Candidatus Micrarchaeaceae archaeon]